MGELKFRVWDDGTYSGESGMIYFDIYHLFNLGIKSLDRPNGYCRPDDKDIMHYTGQDDRDDQPIYTGDIVKHGESIRIVEKKDSRYLATRVSGTETILLSFTNPKVLGNIHQNPELLK